MSWTYSKKNGQQTATAIPLCAKKKLADLSLSGKNKLANHFINKVTVYYGNAIRNNKLFATDMRKTICAIYFHKHLIDSEPLHDFCPSVANSWCTYQKTKIINTLNVFKHKNTMPVPVMDCIKKFSKIF